jgi:glycosyltransferase involved in cell wall biosynthesis
MRILLVAGTYPPDVRGGGEVSSQLLAEMLAGHGADVHVLTTAAAPRSELMNGVSVHRIRSPNASWNMDQGRGPLAKLIWHGGENWNPRARRAVSAVIEEVRPDIVVTSTIENLGGEVWRAADLAKVPCIHILRSHYLLCWRGAMFKGGKNCGDPCLDCRVATFGRRTASNLVTGVIGITDFVLDSHLRRGLFGAQQRAGARAILPDPLLTVGEARSAPAGPRFGFLGVLWPYKGVELLLDAWKEAQAPGASLSIAGTGDPSYVAELKARAGDGVDFRGWVEPSSYLDGIDFLVVPSIGNEPFGRIIVEAYSRGVPVLGATVGGIPELVDDGRSGFLFRGSDAGSLADVIGRAAELDALAYSEMSRKSIEAARQYLPDALAPRYLRFFETFLP